MGNNFIEEDYEKVVEFLNFIAKKAQFKDWTTEDTVEHFKLLAHMQKTILPKIKDHILEVKKVVEPEESSESSEDKE